MIKGETAEQIKQRIKEVGAEAVADELGLLIETVKRYGRMTTEPPKNANVLVFDIETAPMRAYVWSMWKVNVAPVQLISDWHLLSWSAKWLLEPEVLSDVITPDEIEKKDDSRIAKSLWKLLDKADIVIAHRGRKFDVPRANTRFLAAGLKRPSPYRIVDTYDAVKKNFSFARNSLDFINMVLMLSRKIETSFELWSDCMDGSQEALNKMVEYNRNDVLILEELYMAIRGWITSHPNIGIYVEGDDACCPNCGSHNLKEGGEYTTIVNSYKTFQCIDCGAIGRSRYGTISTKKNILVPIAR